MQSQLVGGGEEHQGVGGSNDARVGDRESQGGVGALASLGARRQVSSGDQIQARYLAESHGERVAHGVKGENSLPVGLLPRHLVV